MKTAWIKISESSLKNNEIFLKKTHIQISGELSRTFESTKQVGAQWDCAGPECQLGVDIRGLLVSISDLLLATSHTNSMDMSLSKLQELLKDRKLGVLQSMGSQRVGLD